MHETADGWAKSAAGSFQESQLPRCRLPSIAAGEELSTQVVYKHVKVLAPIHSHRAVFVCTSLDAPPAGVCMVAMTPWSRSSAAPAAAQVMSVHGGHRCLPHNAAHSCHASTSRTRQHNHRLTIYCVLWHLYPVLPHNGTQMAAEHAPIMPHIRVQRPPCA
jgi:hypothetical protein